MKQTIVYASGSWRYEDPRRVAESARPAGRAARLVVIDAEPRSAWAE